MHADMTAVTIQLKKFLNEAQDNQRLLDPPYRKNQNILANLVSGREMQLVRNWPDFTPGPITYDHGRNMASRESFSKWVLYPLRDS